MHFREKKTRILIRKQICLHFSSLNNGEKIKFPLMYRGALHDWSITSDTLAFTSVCLLSDKISPVLVSGGGLCVRVRMASHLLQSLHCITESHQDNGCGVLQAPHTVFIITI